MTRSPGRVPLIHVALLVLIGGGSFLLLCVVYLVLPRLTGALSAEQLASDWLFLLGRAVTTALIVVALAHVSLVLGWCETRVFWTVLVLMLPVVWLDRVLPWHRVEPAWVRPVTTCLVFAGVASLVVFVALRRVWLAAILRLFESLLTGRGWATVLAGLALPVRFGLMMYMPTPAVEIPVTARAQHVPAPADYVGLSNPFEDPEFTVVLDDIGPGDDEVHKIIEQAVPNRSAGWATELMTNLPRPIREVADLETARTLASRLEQAGAKCSVQNALDAFVELVAADRQTPIGKPSQVLDDQFLRTGRDAIAELRAAMPNADRELVKRAFVAFKTAEGRALYQINCRPCHGTKGTGDGPMAAGFSLRPANFRDPQTIASLKPGEVLWRIEHGAAGLPPQATPWDSSMPAWRHELDRELVWKIILGEFNTAGVTAVVNADSSSPEQNERSGINVQTLEVGDHQSKIKNQKSKIAPTWLDWPVPPKPASENMRDPEFVTRGQYLYSFRCTPCHGVTGGGDGPAANTMWPRPRDFTTKGFEQEAAKPKFKFRTTKQGWLPTDEDLYRTISRGLTGTAMEGWGDVLAPDEIWQVIAYLKMLSPAWNDPEHIAKNPNDPVAVQEYAEPDGSGPVLDFAARTPPPITRELLRDGEEAFRRMQCWQCHGIEARGDGAALGQHHDDWGYRTWPQNLANPANFKAGHTVREIFRTFTTSLDGSVMPVYPANILDKQDPKHGEHLQWALASYVYSLARTVQTDTASGIVRARRVSRAPPVDPLDPQWDAIAGTVVPLSGQVLLPPRWQTPSVNFVTVKAAYNTDRIAVWLHWDDRRPNVTDRPAPDDLEPEEQNPLGPKSYSFPGLKKKAPVVFDRRDQLELQWPSQPARGAARPPLLYGDADNPVVLWRWHADRQGLTVRKHSVTIGDNHVERLECTESSGAEASGNPSAVEALLAHGPGDVRRVGRVREDPPSTEAGETDNVLHVERHTGSGIDSRAHWSNGAWTLVLSRPLAVPADWDVDFPATGTAAQPGRRRPTVPLAVHIWDGLAGESDLRMAMSSWIYLAFEQSRSAWVHLAAVATALVVAAFEVAVALRYRSAIASPDRAV